MGDTETLTGCIIALLLLNTFIFLYNLEPITSENFQFTEVGVNQFETGVNESGVNSNNPISIGWGIVKFFLNIVILLFGFFPNFSFIVNILIKFGTYIFAIPMFVILVRMIRGV